MNSHTQNSKINKRDFFFIWKAMKNNVKNNFCQFFLLVCFISCRVSLNSLFYRLRHSLFSLRAFIFFPLKLDSDKKYKVMRKNVETNTHLLIYEFSCCEKSENIEISTVCSNKTRDNRKNGIFIQIRIFLTNSVAFSVQGEIFIVRIGIR